MWIAALWQFSVTEMAALQLTAMSPSKSLASRPHWHWIPMRVLLMTFLLTLLAFAASLLLGILGLVIAGRLRGFHPNMTMAYRYVALPVAVGVGAVVFVSACVMEIRQYRQTKALAEIERISG